MYCIKQITAPPQTNRNEEERLFDVLHQTADEGGRDPKIDEQRQDVV